MFDGVKAFQKRGGSGKKEARAELSSSLSAMAGYSCSCVYARVVMIKGATRSADRAEVARGMRGGSWVECLVFMMSV